MVCDRNIVEQLVEIYHREYWHKFRMDDRSALIYHAERIANGNIYVYEENGIVLGYYERYLVGDTCFLWNIYSNGCFKKLYKEFMDTLPSNIKYIVGEKQKLGGKIRKVNLHGKH